MNIVSPFGRLSRKGYLAVAVPVLISIVALDWVTWQFSPAPSGSVADPSGTPWLRWLSIAGPLGYILTWSLFCACVKRLHDFRWTGAFALPLLWSWLGAILPFAIMAWNLAGGIRQLMEELMALGLGMRFYTWALLILLAIVPGKKPAGGPDQAAPAEVF